MKRCVVASATGGGASSRAVEEVSLREKLKRRTRSYKEFDINRQYGDVGSHDPVMLGEVLEVSSHSPHFPALRSFVDCRPFRCGQFRALRVFTYFE